MARLKLTVYLPGFQRLHFAIMAEKFSFVRTSLIIVLFVGSVNQNMLEDTRQFHRALSPIVCRGAGLVKHADI